MSSRPTAALVDPLGDPVRGIGQPRAEREQVALDLLEHRRRARRRAPAARTSAEPGVQLVDVAVGRDARVRLRARACRRTARSRRIAGPGVDFHGHDYPAGFARSVTACHHDRCRHPGAPQDADRSHCPTRSPAVVPPPPARLVSPQRPRPAVAADQRPVPHPRLRGDAAADAGRSRAAEVPRVARASIRRLDGARRRAAKPTCRRPGGRSATTSVRAGCTPSRASRSRATAARCRRTKRRCCRSRASARTPPARCSALRSASARRSSTPTSRACCSASSSARGDPEVARDAAAPVGRLADGAADAPRLRLQPGADGLRRDALHGAQAEVPALPDARRLRQPIRSTPRRAPAPVTPLPRIVVTAAVIERDGAFLVTRRPAGVHLEGYWEFPGGKCEPGESHEACLAREIREELGRRRRASAARCSPVSARLPRPDRRAALLRRARCTGSRAPMLGQEMRWVAQAELRPPVSAGRRRADRAAGARLTPLERLDAAHLAEAGVARVGDADRVDLQFAPCR